MKVIERELGRRMAGRRARRCRKAIGRAGLAEGRKEREKNLCEEDGEK
jgi:hypothetical protein